MKICPLCNRAILGETKDDIEARDFVIIYLHKKLGYGRAKLGKVFHLNPTTIRGIIDEKFKEKQLERLRKHIAIKKNAIVNSVS